MATGASGATATYNGHRRVTATGAMARMTTAVTKTCFRRRGQGQGGNDGGGDGGGEDGSGEGGRGDGGGGLGGGGEGRSRHRRKLASFMTYLVR